VSLIINLRFCLEWYNVDVYTQKYSHQYAQTCYALSHSVFTLNDLKQKIKVKRLNYCCGKSFTTR